MSIAQHPDYLFLNLPEPYGFFCNVGFAFRNRVSIRFRGSEHILVLGTAVSTQSIRSNRLLCIRSCACFYSGTPETHGSITYTASSNRAASASNCPGDCDYSSCLEKGVLSTTVTIEHDSIRMHGPSG
jgi:hypothetical protein